MKILCMCVIAAVATQATPVVAVQTATVQSFSTEAQTFVSPGETISVPAETRTFTIPGQSVTIPQRSVTIPGRNYRLIEATSTGVPQTRVSTPVCDPGSCQKEHEQDYRNPDVGRGVSVDVDAGGRGLFRRGGRKGRRTGARVGLRLFRRNR